MVRLRNPLQSPFVESIDQQGSLYFPFLRSCCYVIQWSVVQARGWLREALPNGRLIGRKKGFFYDVNPAHTCKRGNPFLCRASIG